MVNILAMNSVESIEIVLTIVSFTLCLSFLIYFRYGQLSGLVEPIAGVLGALLVGIMNPILPYALAFAAGAMVYVVIDDIIPEAQTW